MRFLNDSQRKAAFARFAQHGCAGSRIFYKSGDLNSFSHSVDFIPASKISDVRRRDRANAIYTGVISGMIDPDILSTDDRQLFIDTQERLEERIYDLKLKYDDDRASSSLKAFFDNRKRSPEYTKDTHFFSHRSDRFIRPDYLKGDRRFVSVEVSIPKFEKAWKNNPQNYFEKGEVASPERYESVERFIDEGKKIDKPEVYSESLIDSVKVADGRHRIAVLRDKGDKKMEIMVPGFQKDYFVEKFGV